MLQLIKKYKEWVTLAGVALAFLLFFGVGLYLQQQGRRENEQPPAVTVQQLDLPANRQDPGRKQRDNVGGSSTYFLRPSPEELLDQLASLENLNEQAVSAKYQQLAVLWPAYFFALQRGEGGKTYLLAEVSEDGFGIALQSEVDPAAFPELATLEQGAKIWLGGMIQAIDPAGTGTIYLKIEQLRVGAEAPFRQAGQAAER